MSGGGREGHSLSDHITRAKFSLQELGLSSALLPLCPLVLSASYRSARLCAVWLPLEGRKLRSVWGCLL